MRLRHANLTTTFPVLAGLTLLAFSVVPAPTASAQVLSNIVQVEEYWELRIGEPDDEVSAPQTTMVMSPITDLSGFHFLFILNHVNAPGFEAGGLHAQFWDGNDLVQDAIAGEVGALNSNGEVIRWVQRMKVVGGVLTFEVINGESDTWGNFGGLDLKFVVPTTEITRLNDYRPAVSIGESQVSYAENRVTSLVLTKLRWIKQNGQVQEQTAPIPVDTTLD